MTHIKDVQMPTTREEADANRQHVAELMVAAGPNHFDMDGWCEETECGTTYCIAGWGAVAMGLGRSKLEWGLAAWTSESVARWLGLNDKLLFYDDIHTPEDAALALKQYPYRGGLT